MAGKRTLASLKDFTQAPNSRAALDTLLYSDDVDYKGLRKLLKNIGEEKSERLSKSQVTRTIEVRLCVNSVIFLRVCLFCVHSGVSFPRRSERRAFAIFPFSRSNAF